MTDVIQKTDLFWSMLSCTERKWKRNGEAIVLDKVPVKVVAD